VDEWKVLMHEGWCCFSEETSVDFSGYRMYRRQADGQTIVKGGHALDNSFFNKAKDLPFFVNKEEVQSLAGALDNSWAVPHSVAMVPYQW
jgi:hypothetical protein